MDKLHVVVKGKVQGVWFRAWTRDVGAQMGLTGWVRNLADGNVEAEAVGERALLEEFLVRLYDGPPLARVHDIATTWSQGEEASGGFRVVR